MKAITALLLLRVSAFSFVALAEKPQSNGSDQLAQLLFNNPNSLRTGVKELKLIIISFADYNCPYYKQPDPLLEKIVHDSPGIQFIIKLLPSKGRNLVNVTKVALPT